MRLNPLPRRKCKAGAAIFFNLGHVIARGCRRTVLYMQVVDE